MAIKSLGTTQPSDWIELAQKAASLEGVTLSEFVGLAMVERSFKILNVSKSEGWKKLSPRTKYWERKK